jgi:hypothetical protein
MSLPPALEVDFKLSFKIKHLTTQASSSDPVFGTDFANPRRKFCRIARRWLEAYFPSRASAGGADTMIPMWNDYHSASE